MPLEEQERTRWHAEAIGEGLAVLEAALALKRRGPYQLQAAIAALHAEALRAEDTDWKQIAALYSGLLREQPGAVVELNAAVALAMAEGPERGLAWIDAHRRRAASLPAITCCPPRAPTCCAASAAAPKQPPPTTPPSP